ncbi:hypothetical protein [uncultured Dokdonia sp.]|uniref:hypothetical protein n=1 Tax=uncultured Dokdonia sp. TaxID=575653 RepID=UPI0030ECAA79|tara:strand:- start:8637 stop:9233 length:597 start_codon:yes stop_codon:yes gene_type:complete
MEKIVEASLKKAATTLKESYEQFLKQENTYSITLNSSYFHQDYCKIRNITTCEEHNEVFEKLKAIRKPVLYWFEIGTSDYSVQDIRKEYITYRNNMKEKGGTDTSYRNTAAYKENISPQSTTLYVGKVQIYFWGRLVTHLGYTNNKHTAGMQLFHWYNPNEFGDITLRYIVFDDNMKYLITALEKELALALRPLIGRY